MKRNLVFLLFLLTFVFSATAQVGINANNDSPDNSAMLDVSSSSKGMLVPRMTTAQIFAINAPANGLLVFSVDDNRYYFNKGTPNAPDWSVLNTQWGSFGPNLYYNGGRVGIGTIDPWFNLDIRGTNNDDGAVFQVGNADLSHRMTFFGGRQYDPNPFINWKHGDPLRFTTDEGGWSEKMRITSDGKLALGTEYPHSSAKLDVSSTSQGFLPPRMTREQMNNVVDPANGLMVYCTDCSASGTGTLAMYIVDAWNIFTPSCLAPLPLQGEHLSATTEIIWHWQAVSDATGYKWNTTNDYASATDMGMATSKTEQGLDCNTYYTRYLWAYSSCGVSAPISLYSNTLPCNLPCSGIPTVSYGGTTYNTIQIGTQCWLKENLNIGTVINGTQEQTDNSSIEKYCYDDLAINCDTYGGLYQWNELMNYTGSSNTNPSMRQGICPSGWHVPSDAEWCQMETFLDATVDCNSGGWLGTDAGGKMKETGTTHWANPNTGATNISGFTALPSGNRTDSGSYSNKDFYGYFWSATESYGTSAFARETGYDHPNVTRINWSGKSFSFSGRCIKDQ